MDIVLGTIISHIYPNWGIMALCRALSKPYEQYIYKVNPYPFAFLLSNFLIRTMSLMLDRDDIVEASR